MTSGNLKTRLRKHLLRYRIAIVDLLLETVAQDDRTQAMRILQNHTDFQLFESVSGDRCVCLCRRQLPSTNAVAGCLASYAFCCSAVAKRTLLTKLDVRQYFPMLFRHGLPSGYYVDTTGQVPVLGLLRVDLHLTTVNRIWQRSSELFEKHRRHREFRKLILNHQFEIAWAVPTESKARSVNSLVAQRGKAHFQLLAEHAPILLNQLVSLPKAFPDVVGL